MSPCAVMPGLPVWHAVNRKRLISCWLQACGAVFWQIQYACWADMWMGIGKVSRGSGREEGWACELSVWHLVPGMYFTGAADRGAALGRAAGKHYQSQGGFCNPMKVPHWTCAFVKVLWNFKVMCSEMLSQSIPFGMELWASISPLNRVLASICNAVLEYKNM